MNDTPIYRTSDRYLISWIRYCGHQHLRTELEDGRKVWFVFENTSALKSDIDNFYKKQAFEIIPFDFVREINAVTDIIYQVKNQNG